MTRIGVRELRQHASRYLELVRAGEVVEVTVRGELVALLQPPDPSATERDRLIAAGRLTPARTPFRFPPRRHEEGRRASEVLSEQRRERPT